MADEKAPTKMLLTHFDTCHRAKFSGLPALIRGAKHGAMLAQVWRIYGSERLTQLMDVFFAGNAFADDCGYSVEVFVSQIPRTLMRLERERLVDDWESECRAQHGGTCATAYLHSVRRTG